MLEFTADRLMRKFFALAVFAIAVASGAFVHYARGSHLSWNDVIAFPATGPAVGVLSGDPLARLGLTTADLKAEPAGATIRFVGKSKYLNGARAVVTHTIDDSTKFIPTALDGMDKYGIKATVFVSTERGPIAQLWPRLQQAIGNGHEIGSHSRRHQCQWPDTFGFCFRAYTDYEINGSRDDILKNTDQPYVWSWCYPCGNCADRDFAHRKLARAGYLVARNYPGEAQDRHNLPNLQTFDDDVYNATYTQTVQKRGGIAKSGRTDVRVLNAKFDEVYQAGGIYNFMSHPQWLDFGADQFYEQHLAYVGGRNDVWYVPMGPLYGYRTIREKTDVRWLDSKDAKARLAIYNNLDAKAYPASITLEFATPEGSQILAAGKPVLVRAAGPTNRWDSSYFRRSGEAVLVTIPPNTILEFR
jgi:peptidoglycan/xylan/chitin deacetylase (PgdA/CDA1 family)